MKRHSKLPRRAGSHAEHWRLRTANRVLLALLCAFASLGLLAAAYFPILDSVVSGLEFAGLVPRPLPAGTYGGNVWAGRTYPGREAPVVVVACVPCVTLVTALTPFLLAVLVYDRLTWRKLVADPRPRCSACDYLLVALEQPRCPECGTEFLREQEASRA